jgi:hypothetical protein
MVRMTSKLTTTLAGLALASLPFMVAAQSTSTPQQSRPRQGTDPTSQQNRAPRAGDQNSPQYHLDQAKRVLTTINATTVKGETGRQIRELKRHFNQLEAAWRANSASAARVGAARSTDHTGAHSPTAGSTSGTGTATAGTSGTATGSTTTEQTGTGARQTPRSGAATGASGANDWVTHYTAITNLLDQLGATSASVSSQAGTPASTAAGTTAGTTASATGTTGRPGEEVGVSATANVNLDANVRTKLVEFRRHLDQFHMAAMGQRGRGEEDVASANPESGITGSMTGTGTSPSATGTTGAASETTVATTGTAAQTPAQTTSATSASATVDSATIARLTASIDELLRGGAVTSTAAGTTTGTTGSATAPGTTGTAGTTSATGTVCVDRAKLEQLRRDIQALQNPPRQ